MEKKKLLILVGSICLVLALMVMAFMPACAKPAPEKVDLTYNILFPAVNYHGVLAQEWANEINKRTDGVVTITLYPVGGLAPPAETYEAVTKGIADIGMSCLAYTMGRFPACELVDIPHGYPNGTALRNSTTSTRQTGMQQKAMAWG